MRVQLRDDQTCIADGVVVGTILACGFLMSGQGASACTLLMSPNAGQTAGRVAGMTLALTHGAIEGVGPVPVGWRVRIDNEPSWTATVAAHAILGAAFLDEGVLPGAIPVRPEPHFTRGDILRRGRLAASLTLYRAREGRLVEVRVKPSGLRMTE